MKNRNQVLKYSIPVLVMGVVGSAQAALPAEATSAFSALSGNVTDIFAAIWPIVAAVTGGFVLISLFKKGASKVA